MDNGDDDNGNSNNNAKEDKKRKEVKSHKLYLLQPELVLESLSPVLMIIVR